MTLQQNLGFFLTARRVWRPTDISFFHHKLTSRQTLHMVNSDRSYTVDDNVRFINSTVNSVYELVALIPGSDIIMNYLKESYQHDPFRVVLELFLVFFVIKYMLAKRYKPNDNSVKLTSKVCRFSFWQQRQFLFRSMDSLNFKPFFNCLSTFFIII